jgi:hypothetical protein
MRWRVARGLAGAYAAAEAWCFTSHRYRVADMDSAKRCAPRGVAARPSSFEKKIQTRPSGFFLAADPTDR